MIRLRATRWHRMLFLYCSSLHASLAALPLLAKTEVDFDPNLNFSKYKTFAFIGGVENLVMLPVDSVVMDNRVRRAVTRELTGKGLREVQPGQIPDLVVRYLVTTSQQVNVGTLGNWGPYGPSIGSYWGWMYDSVSAASKDGSLLVDLIDAKGKNLAWRVYLIRKLTSSDKDWNKADEDFAKAFQSYPPSDKDKEAKRKERTEHAPKPNQP